MSPGILNDSEGGRKLAKFLHELELVRWFSNIGKHVESTEVEQIHSWKEWRGPEDSGLVEISCRQQELYDELESLAGRPIPNVNQIWEHIHSEVFRNSTDKIPYEEGRDTWYGPTAAVWHAAWTAGLIGLCEFLNRPVPADLNNQWGWFVKGHWPCGWVGEFPNGKLLLY